MAAKKAKSEKDKKSAARRVAIRELNEPDWWRLAKVHRELKPHLGKHAAKDLMKELKSGRLRCVRRIETDPKYAEDVLTKFWQSLPWPGKLFFDRLGTYDPEFYGRQPWEVWPKLQAANGTETSKPERKRAKGGGAKSMYTDEQTEFGKAIYRKMLQDDPSWRSTSQDAVAKRVQEMAKKAGCELLGCPRTVYRNIVAPVNAATE
jgi:hypothetical protein